MTVGTTITSFEDDQIQELVGKGRFLDKADFARQAIREKLLREKQ